MALADLHRCRSCGTLVKLQEDVRELREVDCECISCGRSTTYSKVGFHLPMWTIYASPMDCPGRFLVRLFIDSAPTLRSWIALTIGEARSTIPQGLYRLDRSPEDHPSVVETWL